MENITIEKLLDVVRNYNPEEEEIIKKAYDYANYLHQGQMRQSGEPYISHPLNVAYILAEMRADRDTVCAALLHDTLEDTNTTKEDIINENLFGYGREHKYFKDSLGDYFALGVGNKYFKYDNNGDFFKSVHAGFTVDEMKIPLIIVDKSSRKS